MQERRRGRKVSTKGGYILSFLREERLGEKVELSLQERRRGRKVSFFKGKEGRGDFRKTLLLAKDFANERNESLLSNCRVQLAITYLWE